MSTIHVKPVSDLRIDKLDIFKQIGQRTYFKDMTRPSIVEKIKLIHDYTDTPIEVLETVKVKILNNIYTEICTKLAEHVPKPPPKVIEIEGNKYKLVEKFTEMPYSWHELVRRSDFNELPIRMASLAYIEHDLKYAQSGDYGIILNPTTERDELFTKHLPLTTYLDLADFFLKKFNVLHPLFVKLQEARNQTETEKKRKK